MKSSAIHRCRPPVGALAFGTMLLISTGLMAEQKGSPLNSRDEQFVQHEAATGALTVQFGELGARKAQSTDVKAFASMIVTEHTKLNAELIQMAANKGVDIPTAVDSQKANTLEKLEKATGAEFDKLFLAELQNGHKQCVSSLEEASKKSQDEDLKKWVDRTLPLLRKHHTRINELSSSVMAQMPPEAHKMARQGAADGTDLTPLDQGSSRYDTETTAKIRREILASGKMSITAQNVKIITSNGRVTLRGPVNTPEEKRLIGELAARHVSPTQLDNFLEVPTTTRP